LARLPLNQFNQINQINQTDHNNKTKCLKTWLHVTPASIAWRQVLTSLLSGKSGGASGATGKMKENQ